MRRQDRDRFWIASLIGNAVATVVPLEGPITDLDIQLWPAIFCVIRNAFVAGITSGFTHLPPAKAEQKQGVLSQATNALKKDEGSS